VTGTGSPPPETPALPTIRRRAIDAALAKLPPPRRSFASDTTAPALPEAVAAVAAANVGHVASYGDDPWTRDVVARFREAVDDASAQVRLCFSGTGANMLAAGLGARDRLVLAEQSHIAIDEEGGPLRLSGARQTTLPAPGGRIEVAALRNALASGPGLVCVTEATEDGTVYGTDRLREICAAAHGAGSSVLLDGARLAHALAATRATLADVWSTGVDHLVVGGTKAGLMAAEAVVSRSGDAAWWRRSGQLPAKTRFVAAQWAAIFPNGWTASAGAANARAAELAGLLTPAGVAAVHPIEVNLIFLDLDPDSAAALAAWAPVSLWDRPGRVRLATSWDTDSEDVERLAAGIKAACAV
jgi:threonine aldolase